MTRALVAFGGWLIPTVEVYKEASNSWSLLPGTLPGNQMLGAAATVQGASRLLHFGGLDDPPSQSPIVPNDYVVEVSADATSWSDVSDDFGSFGGGAFAATPYQHCAGSCGEGVNLGITYREGFGFQGTASFWLQKKILGKYVPFCSHGD